MGLFSEEKDYEEIVKQNISMAKLLSSIPEENRETAVALLKEKEEIMKKNGLFVSFQLKKIEKKINKLKKVEN